MSKYYVVSSEILPEVLEKVIISFVIRHEKGALAQVINLLSRSQANILSLNQTAPINGIASLTITIDMADLETSPEDLIRVLQDLPAVSRTELVAVE